MKFLLYKNHMYEAIYQTDMFLSDEESKSKYSDYLSKEESKEILAALKEYEDELGYELKLNDYSEAQELVNYVFDKIDNKKDLEKLLKVKNIDFRVIKLKDESELIKTDEYVIIRAKDGKIEDILNNKDFMYNIKANPFDYIPLELATTFDPDEYFKEFWENPVPIYAIIRNAAVKSLPQYGLVPTDRVYGLARKDMETCITAHIKKPDIRYSGSVTVEINTNAMKLDGIQPYISKEKDVANLKAVTVLLKIYDYEEEIADLDVNDRGLVHVFAKIEPKYLKVHKQ